MIYRPKHINTNKNSTILNNYVLIISVKMKKMRNELKFQGVFHFYIQLNKSKCSLSKCLQFQCSTNPVVEKHQNHVIKLKWVCNKKNKK